MKAIRGACPLNTVIVLLGVSGSGKTSVGKALADAIGGDFFDADVFHPPANIEKMSRGEALCDADRMPWLDAIARAIREQLRATRPAVFTCSGLKPEYRRRLAVDPAVRMFLLDGSREELQRRLGLRKGHFFPASLLDSQLRTLVRPTPEENVAVIDGDLPVAEIVRDIQKSLGNAKSKFGPSSQGLPGGASH